MEEKNLDDKAIDEQNDFIVSVEEYKRAVVSTSDWTVKSMVDLIKNGSIDLDPKFQRRAAWNKTRKYNLIQSFMLGLPVPHIILAEKKDNSGGYIVIDGKQRLLTLRQFFAEKDDLVFKPLKLGKLDVLSNLYGKSYHRMKQDQEYKQYVTTLENQAVRTIVIKNWPNEDYLYKVFLTLNTGSMQLSAQELRQALHPGPFLDFCDSFAIKNKWINKYLGVVGVDSRMRDVELILRYFCIKIFIDEFPLKMSNNMKVFIDRCLEKLNSTWEDKKEKIIGLSKQFDKAMEFVYQVWGENAFRRFKDGEYVGGTTKSLFDIFTYYFSEPEIREAFMKQPMQLEQAFKDLCSEDIVYLMGLETRQQNPDVFGMRFNKTGKMIATLTNLNIQEPFI